ncbi:hypothetical protein F4703DRAFT_1772674 [Phycomyces blakesleeanus]
MQINTKILCQKVLRVTLRISMNKLELWGKVLGLDSKNFFEQQNGTIKFRGAIQIDGVGISTLKQAQDTTK